MGDTTDLGRAASAGSIVYRQIVDKILEGTGGIMNDRGELKDLRQTCLCARLSTTNAT